MKYAAQEIPQIDTEVAEKGHLWMETSQPGYFTTCCRETVEMTVPPGNRRELDLNRT